MKSILDYSWFSTLRELLIHENSAQCYFWWRKFKTMEPLSQCIDSKAVKTLKDCALKKQDSRILGLVMSCDLIAVEARYHYRSCYRNYTRSDSASQYNINEATMRWPSLTFPTTPFPARGFPPDTASSTRPKAQAWQQFNRHALDNNGWIWRNCWQLEMRDISHL